MVEKTREPVASSRGQGFEATMADQANLLLRKQLRGALRRAEGIAGGNGGKGRMEKRTAKEGKTRSKAVPVNVDGTDGRNHDDVERGTMTC